MRLRHLALAHFRRFAAFDHAFAPGPTIIWGDNGAGKSNLVEAAYLLATSRSPYSSSERDLIAWDCPHRPAFARTIGDCESHSRPVRIEIRLVEPGGIHSLADPGAAPGSDEPYHPPSVRRRALIDGQPKAIGEILGHLNAVHFSPEEVELVAGPGERRRRFLDIALSQLDRAYVRSLRRFQRAIVQRNAMLRRLRDDPALPRTQLDPWDAEAVAHGAVVIACRLRAVSRLNEALASLDGTAPGAAPIRADYVPSVDLRAINVPDGPYIRGWDEGDPQVVAVASAMARAMTASRGRDLGAGTTLVGPHRDDLVVRAAGIDQRLYGSRGQQRTAALAMKVAEAHLMAEVTGEKPVLLLDDVMSELDPGRRQFVEALAIDTDQAIVTGTEAAVFSDRFRGAASTYRLQHGNLVRA